MRNSTNVTVTGWVATDPKLVTSDSGVDFVSFRVAATPRYFDRGEEKWVDGKTEWFTVKAWRETARNLALSIRKSQPVVVHGRLVTTEWESENGLRKDVVVEAFAVGHDLTHGNAVFKRTTGSSTANASDGLTENQSADDLGLVEESATITGLAVEPIPA